METKELLEQVKANKDNAELLKGLKDLNLIEVEVKEVKTPAEYTDDGVAAYLKNNKSLTDKLYNDNVKKFLAKKLGKDIKQVKDEDLALELVPKEALATETEKAKTKMIDFAMAQAFGDKADLLKPHIDYKAITMDDSFNLQGIEEQETAVKEKFKFLFDTAPAAGGTGYHAGAPKTLQVQLEEAKKRAEETGNINDRAAYQNLKLQIQNGGNK